MKGWIIKWFLGGIVRDMAEGKKGDALAKIYWWLANRKRTWGAIAGLIFAGWAAYDPASAIEWAPTMTFALGLLVTAGLVDKEWRTAAPPAEWAAVLQKIMSAGPALAAITALLVEWLPQIPGCPRCAEFVPQIQWAAAAFGAVTAWLAAKFAQPPAFPAKLDRRKIPTVVNGEVPMRPPIRR